MSTRRREGMRMRVSKRVNKGESEHQKQENNEVGEKGWTEKRAKKMMTAKTTEKVKKSKNEHRERVERE
jgi:hypothetical protein